MWLPVGHAENDSGTMKQNDLQEIGFVCPKNAMNLSPGTGLAPFRTVLPPSAVPRNARRAFRRAAQVVENLPAEELDRRIRESALQSLAGIGTVTAEVITQAAGGQQPDYVVKLLAEAPPAKERTGLRAALRGDCHTHSDWSDGRSEKRRVGKECRSRPPAD